MALNIAVFKTRALTAIVFVIVMLTGLLVSYWSFVGLFTIIFLGCCYEYLKLADLINAKHIQILKYGKLLPVVIAVILFAEIAFIDYITPSIKLYLKIPYTIIFLCIPILLFSQLTTRSDKEKAGYYLYPLLAAASFGSLILLRKNAITTPITHNYYNGGLLLVLTLIGSIWINDTMAYIVGSFIGKTPLSVISPKKTWEGTIGGIILAIAIVVAITVYWLAILPLQHAITVSATAAIMGTFGDLLESKLKRMAGVKDSGSFMPGHGGFLDRFDSLILAAPFVFFVLQLIK